MNANPMETGRPAATSEQSDDLPGQETQKVMHAITAHRLAFRMKKADMEKDIDRGARLTEHRISL